MDLDVARRRMVENVLKPAGVRDERLLKAMGAIPRHHFVSDALASQAYMDNSLPIGFQQTISKPSIVARMLDALHLDRGERVLEVGTGSGYQTAILSHLCRDVFSVDVIESFVLRTKKLLSEMTCYNVRVRTVHDEIGWPEHGPFDAIVVSACMDRLLPSLIDQVRIDGGRLVAPVQRGREQRLALLMRSSSRIQEVDLGPCTFVPFRHQERGRQAGGR